MGRSELVADVLEYGEDLNTYIDVIVRELEAVQRNTPESSVFLDLLTEAETVAAAVEQEIAYVQQSVFDGAEDLPIDRITGAIPPWMKVIENGHCADGRTDSALKRALLIDSPTVLGRIIHRNDLRPVRAGWGSLEACVRTEPQRYQGAWYVELKLTVDFYPDPRMRVDCTAEPVRLVGETRYVATSRWPSEERWRYLVRKGSDALLSRASPVPVLPVGCRYRDHATRFDAENEEVVASRVRDRVRRTLEEANARLDKGEATLLSWLTTAFDGDRLLLGVVRNLVFPDLHVLVADDPGRAGVEARKQLDSVRQILRSDAMRQVVRLDRGQLVLSRTSGR